MAVSGTTVISAIRAGKTCCDPVFIWYHQQKREKWKQFVVSDMVYHTGTSDCGTGGNQ